MGIRAKIGAIVIVLAVAGAIQADEDPTPDPAASADQVPQPAPATEADDEGEPDGGEEHVDEASRRGRPKRSSGPRPLVVRVIDGDTIEVLLNGAPRSLRLIGIDTPETVHPSQPVECYGLAASDYTGRKLEGRRVRLEFDVERRDHYGRLLAYVWVGKSLFNRKIVADGFAQISTYPPNVKYVDRILRAQRSARNASRGLWGACPMGSAHNGSGGSANPEAVAVTGNGKCTAGYDPCLAPAEDYDCAGGDGNGPRYARGPIKVTGSDPYDLDSDGDGIACAS